MKHTIHAAAFRPRCRASGLGEAARKAVEAAASVVE